VLHGGTVAVAKYLADFVYDERVGQDWIRRVEDVKGMDTAVSRLKRKWLKGEYGITVQIVR